MLLRFRYIIILQQLSVIFVWYAVTPTFTFNIYISCDLTHISCELTPVRTYLGVDRSHTGNAAPFKFTGASPALVTSSRALSPCDNARRNAQTCQLPDFTEDWNPNSCTKGSYCCPTSCPGLRVCVSLAHTTGCPKKCDPGCDSESCCEQNEHCPHGVCIPRDFLNGDLFRSLKKPK